MILKIDWDFYLDSKMYLKLFLVSEDENTTDLAAFESKNMFIIVRSILLRYVEYYKRLKNDYLLSKFYAGAVANIQVWLFHLMNVPLPVPYGSEEVTIVRKTLLKELQLRYKFTQVSLIFYFHNHI